MFTNCSDIKTKLPMLLYIQVGDVQADEKYSCVVRAVAGETSITKATDVFSKLSSFRAKSL